VTASSGQLDFSGKHVLVTGASKGIGAACARLFARLGADVGIHYRADAVGAHGVASAVREYGRRAALLAADLAEWNAGDALVQECERALGPLDVVVLNHGIWKGAPIGAMTEGDYDEMLDANLRGVFSVSGAAVRSMKARKSGRLVFVASTAGQRGEAEHAHYAATKGAIISLTKSLATELAPDGILVNCVAPGWVRTPMTEPALAHDETRAWVEKQIPLGRVASPEEIAAPVAFVASELASFMTGEIVNVNGGAVLVG
jgi:3-oxoacyl-[acyl-carrier protein] reductase